jgi:hypothetical protein
MSIDEHIEKLRRFRDELVETQVEDALLSTLDAIALLKLRLASGENSTGGQFSDYSTLYSNQRADRGLQTGVKDFNVSGQLYISILPEVVSSEPGTVHVDVVPRGNDNQNKVKGQFKRDGNILLPSKDEIKDVTVAYSRRRIVRINSLFGK